MEHLELINNFNIYSGQFNLINPLDNLAYINRVAKAACINRTTRLECNVDVEGNNIVTYLGYNDGRMLVKLKADKPENVKRWLADDDLVMYVIDAKTRELVYAIRSIPIEGKKNILIKYKYPWPVYMSRVTDDVSKPTRLIHYKVKMTFCGKEYWLKSMRRHNSYMRVRAYEVDTHKAAPMFTYNPLSYGGFYNLELDKLSHLYLANDNLWHATYNECQQPILYHPMGIYPGTTGHTLEYLLEALVMNSKNVRAKHTLKVLVNDLKLPANKILPTLKLIHGFTVVDTLVRNMKRGGTLKHTKRCGGFGKRYQKSLMYLLYRGGVLQKLTDTDFVSGHYPYKLKPGVLNVSN